MVLDSAFFGYTYMMKKDFDKRLFALSRREKIEPKIDSILPFRLDHLDPNTVDDRMPS